MVSGASIIISNCMFVKDRSKMAQDRKNAAREAMARMTPITA